MEERPVIYIPNLCPKHQSLLVHQVGIPESGPWQAAIMVAQIVLFQGASAHPSTHERIGGDITRIGELGCLACDRPEVFGEIVEAFQTGGFGAVKTLGEEYVKRKD